MNQCNVVAQLVTSQLGAVDLTLTYFYAHRRLGPKSERIENNSHPLQLRNSMDSVPADKVLKRTQLDLQKRFPIYLVCPKCLAARLCGSAIRKSVATSLQVSDEVGMTLVDW